MVIVALTAKYQALSPTSQDELMSTLPALENILPTSRLPLSSDTPLTFSPSPNRDGNLLFLNSEGVQQHNCILTRAEIDDIFSLLSGRVDFRTRQSLGNIIDLTKDDWLGLHLDSVKAPLSFPFSPSFFPFFSIIRFCPGILCQMPIGLLLAFPKSVVGTVSHAM